MPRNKKTDIYAIRRSGTDGKLRAALERLTKGVPTHPDLKSGRHRITVATLAKEARVARSAIYSGHRAIIDQVKSAPPTMRSPALTSWPEKLAEQRTIITGLKTDVRRLASENAALMKRALDAEAEAQSLRRRNARLVADREGPQPFTLAAQRVLKGASGS